MMIRRHIAIVRPLAVAVMALAVGCSDLDNDSDVVKAEASSTPWTSNAGRDAVFLTPTIGELDTAYPAVDAAIGGLHELLSADLLGKSDLLTRAEEDISVFLAGDHDDFRRWGEVQPWRTPLWDNVEQSAERWGRTRSTLVGDIWVEGIRARRIDDFESAPRPTLPGVAIGSTVRSSRPLAKMGMRVPSESLQLIEVLVPMRIKSTAGHAHDAVVGYRYAIDQNGASTLVEIAVHSTPEALAEGMYSLAL